MVQLAGSIRFYLARSGTIELSNFIHFDHETAERKK